jgi:hypothetical protein
LSIPKTAACPNFIRNETLNRDLVLAARINEERVPTAATASEWFSGSCHRPHPYRL